MATPTTNQLDQLRKAIKRVVTNNYAKTHDAVKKKDTLEALARQLVEYGIINEPTADNPEYEAIMNDFTAALPFLRTEKIENHCNKFIKAFQQLEGGAAKAAGESLREQFQIAAKEAGFDNFLAASKLATSPLLREANPPQTATKAAGGTCKNIYFICQFIQYVDGTNKIASIHAVLY